MEEMKYFQDRTLRMALELLLDLMVSLAGTLMTVSTILAAVIFIVDPV